jgi:hypothetical protein
MQIKHHSASATFSARRRRGESRPVSGGEASRKMQEWERHAQTAMSRGLTTNHENDQSHSRETSHPRLVIPADPGIPAAIPAPVFTVVWFASSRKIYRNGHIKNVISFYIGIEYSPFRIHPGRICSSAWMGLPDCLADFWKDMEQASEDRMIHQWKVVS